MADPIVDLMAVDGRDGVRRYGGIILDEWLPELRGDQGRWVIRQMMTNPVIAGGLRAIELTARSITKSIVPADDSPQAAEVRDFVDSAFNDLSARQNVDGVLSACLSALGYGWAWLDVSFKRREGRRGERPSKWDDGKLGIHLLSKRAQTSLQEWVYNPAGELTGWLQRDWTDGRLHFLPRAKGLHIRLSQSDDNPEPSGILREAYEAWYAAHRLALAELVGFERDLAGLAVVRAPLAWFQDGAGAGDKQMLAALSEMVRRVRRGEGDGLLLPSFRDAAGNEQIVFELIRSGGPKQVDAASTIVRHEQRIAIAMLTDMLMLGHEGVGSLGAAGLAVSKAELFARAVEAWLDAILGELDRLCEMLTELNGWDPMLAPRWERGAADEVPLTELVDMVQKLAAAGAPLFPDNPALLETLLTKAGLPVGETAIVY